jgi:hypothetical protein
MASRVQDGAYRLDAAGQAELTAASATNGGAPIRHRVNGRRQSTLSRTCLPIFELARQLLRRREPNCLQAQGRGR